MQHAPRWAALGLLVLAGQAQAQTTVETFDNGSNQGGWTFGNGFDAIETSGGNPGAWFHNSNLDTFAPQPRTTLPSVFTGDWRSAGVTAFGIDLQTISTQFPALREATLILTNDGGTPGNPNDDCSVYLLGTDTVPQPGTGWKSFDYVVPSQSTTLPAGWNTLGQGCSTPDAAWNHVITDVTQVGLFYGDPTFFFIFDIWDVGLDNPRITMGSGASIYCTAKVNSQGCTPTIQSSGAPSASDPTPFNVGASNVLNNKAGILFYGFSAAAVPFQGGLLCVQPPTRRTPVQNSNGNPPPNDCSGVYGIEFNGVIQGGGDPNLVSGAQVFGQYWTRDPGSPSTTGLTDAISFTILP